MKTRATLFSKASFRVLSLAIALGIAPAAYAQTPITFSGTVFQDGNGLTDNLINGTPIRTVLVGTQQKQIYVYLVEKAANGIDDSASAQATVNVSGQYSINGYTGTTYSLRLSTVNGQLNQIAPAISFTGEFVATGEGNLSDGDGVPDFRVALTAPTTNLTVNFGVEARPLGNDYTIFNPAYIAGASNKFDSVVIPAIALTAFDQEDGQYTAGLAGRSVYVLAGLGGSLYYNGRLLTSFTANPASRIDNFVADSLRFVRTPNAQAFSFSFSVIDDADVDQLVPSTVTINAQPLPVPLFSFEVNRKGTIALVQWSAPAEAAGLGFDVERSTDGRNFINIGHVASVTEGNAAVDYRFEDTNLPSNTASGKVYYRLRQTAYNGQADYSKVAILSTSALLEGATAKLSLYPNPASNVLNVSLNGAPGRTATVILSDATGRMVDSKTTNADGMATLEVSSLPAGMYFVQYRSESSELIATERIAITR